MKNRKGSAQRSKLQQILETPGGPAFVLEAIIARKHRRTVNANVGRARAQASGGEIVGDDFIHPKYGRIVGAGKQLRENPRAEPMVS